MAKKKRTGSDGRTAGGELDFEASLADLEKLVSELESGELGLSESLERYQKGIRRLKDCHTFLESAEKRISLLMRVDDDGTAHLHPIGDEDGADEAADSPGGEAGDVDDGPGLF